MHQIYSEQIDTLRTEIRDLHSLAFRNHLDPEVVRLVSNNGLCLQFETPVAYEQTFPLDDLGDDAFGALRPIHLMCCRALDSLVVITSKFRLIRAGGVGLSVANFSTWHGARSCITLRPGERAECALAWDDTQPPRHVVIISRMGWVRSLTYSAFEQVLYSGQPLVNKSDGDTPVKIICGGGGDLLVFARSGRWIRFPLAAVEPAGSQAMYVDLSDDITEAILIENQPVLYFIGADGAMFGLMAVGLAAHKRTLGKPGNLVRGFRPIACVAAKSAISVLTLGSDLQFDVVATKRLHIAERPGEVKPLNVISRKIAAVAWIR